MRGAEGESRTKTEGPGRSTWWMSRDCSDLQGAKDLGLTLGGDLTSMQVHCDSDWAADPMDRKSTTGYIIRLGAGLISWKRCKQQSVSVSITEAYKALAKCLQEFMWLRQLFHQRKLGVKFP